MARHWQRRPLLLRGGLAGFRDRVTPRRLFELAARAEPESRLVRRGSGRADWSVTWGPQERGFADRLPHARWTLLVQDVHRHVRAVGDLLDHFAFVPNVRVDDVMVSYATPGGGVGPHLDSYDVFLIQGAGARRWRWGSRPVREPSFVGGLDLKILRRFEPEHEALLEAGDVLYLPPGVAHEGVAESVCLTYSVGFRAPTLGELWTAFAEDAAESAAGSVLLADRGAEAVASPGLLPDALLREVRASVRRLGRSELAIDRWFGSFATRRAGAVPVAPRVDGAAVRAARARVRRATSVRRSDAHRWALLRRARRAWLYVGGREIEVSGGALPLAELVADRRDLAVADVLSAATNPVAGRLLAQLFAIGALSARAARRSR